MAKAAKLTFKITTQEIEQCFWKLQAMAIRVDLAKSSKDMSFAT